MDEFISIGKVSQLLGVHPDTIRLWEKSGKITSIRTKGNHRRYRASDVRQMQQAKDKIEKWKSLLSNRGKLDEWLMFYAENDPVFAEAADYAKKHSPDLLMLYQFVLVAVLDKKTMDETSRWYSGA